MAYISGTVTDANPGPVLYALMAPALTTAGYTLVDTVVVTTRTYKIWKSAAASNAQNLDWYLCVGYTTTGAATISLTTFEYYDPATDLGYRGPYTATSTVIDATTSTRYGATGSALETNWWGPASTGNQTSLTTTAFGYWISITADRVILLCSTAASVPMYAGLYEPDPQYTAKAAAKLYPLFTGQIIGGTSLGGTPSAALTRIPPMTAFVSTGDWRNHLLCTPTVPLTSFPALPTGPTTTYPIAATRVMLTSPQSAPLQLTGRWGWLRDVYVVGATAAVVRGDTATIGGDTYLLTTTLTSQAAAFKAA